MKKSVGPPWKEGEIRLGVNKVICFTETVVIWQKLAKQRHVPFNLISQNAIGCLQDVDPN